MYHSLFSWRLYSFLVYRVPFFAYERGYFNRFSSSSYGCTLPYSFILFSRIPFFLFISFFSVCTRRSLHISRLFPDLGNGGIGCIWYFYNHGYERHLLSTVSCKCQRFAVALRSATMLSLMQQGNFHRTTKKKRYRIRRSQGSLLELIFHRIIELSGQNFVYHGGEKLWNLFDNEKINQWTKISRISEKKLAFS